MKVLHTFDQRITISLDSIEKDQALKALNQFYVNDDQCNIFDENNVMVSKYPEIEKSNPAFVESHYACARGHIINIKIDLMEDGHLD
jgi:hypothetical protein